MITIGLVWIVLLAVIALFLARSVRTAHRMLRCPIFGTAMQVNFLEALPEGRPIGVAACSAFKPPTNIVCSQRCLEQLTAESGRLITSAGARSSDKLPLPSHCGQPVARATR